jgi:hypothetical protein
MKMRKMIFCFLFLLCAFSICQRAQSESLSKTTIAPIAIETRANNKFNGFIGTLDFDALQTVAIVVFHRVGFGRVGCLPTVYKVLEEEMRPNSIYHVKAENQYGIILSGIVDVSEKLNPKIALVLEGGILITNISAEGRQMKNEFIPKVFLGSGE